MQSELESAVTEKSFLKTRLNQLEQDLTALQTQNSILEAENIKSTQKQKFLETEFESLKRTLEEEAIEKENKAKETANEIVQRIAKLKAHVIKFKKEFEIIKQ